MAKICQLTATACISEARTAITRPVMWYRKLGNVRATRPSDKRLAPRLQHLHALGRREQHLRGHADKQAVLDHTHGGVQLFGQLHRIQDRSERCVKNVVAAIRDVRLVPGHAHLWIAAEFAQFARGDLPAEWIYL